MSEKDNPNYENQVKKQVDEFLEESELQGGVWIDKLPVGHNLEIQTQSRTYLLEKREDGYYLSGNPEKCPTPTKFVVHGSGAGWLRTGFIGRGLRLEGYLEGGDGIFMSSVIQEITERVAKSEDKTDNV